MLDRIMEVTMIIFVVSGTLFVTVFMLIFILALLGVNVSPHMFYTCKCCG